VGIRVPRSISGCIGRSETKLLFCQDEADFSISVLSYHPGNWELSLDAPYYELSEIGQLSDDATKAVGAGRLQDFNGLVASLGKSELGGAMIRKFKEGQEKAAKGKLHCKSCGHKIDKNRFVTPIFTVFCDKCGFFLEW
jgi:hypothetical protein